MAKTLTAKAVENAKPRSARVEIPDGGCQGLYLVVQTSGAKSWCVRYRLAGKPKKLTLGPVLVLDGAKEPEKPVMGGPLTLKGARQLTTKALGEVGQGKDPGETKKANAESKRAADADTFEAIAELYMKMEGNELRSADWRRALLERLVYPTLGNKPIASIRRKDITGLLDKIQTGDLKVDGEKIDGGPVMADHTLRLIRRVTNWHGSRDEDFKSPIARGMARIKPKDRARKRTLNDDELRAVWKAADEWPADKPGAVFAVLVQFILLTAARRNEAARMANDELTGSDWTIPSERYKTKRAHLIPLSTMAVGVLDRLQKADRFIFTTDGRTPISGFSKPKRAFDKTCGVAGWSLHDLRRTARSLMSRARVPSDHAERALGHTMSAMRETYDVHEYRDEKAEAFEALAKQIEQVINPPPKAPEVQEDNKVLPFRSRGEHAAQA